MTTVLFVLFFLLLGVAVVLFAMRSGSKGPVLDSGRKTGRRSVALIVAVVVLIFGVGLPIATAIDNAANADKQAGTVDLTAKEVRGRQIFAGNCSQCHQLAASNAPSRVGPDLDELRPPKALILDAIEKGRAGGAGQMPAMVVTGQDAEDVAAYIVRVAGRE